MGRVDEEIQAAAEALGDTDDPAAGLGLLAQRFLESVRRPRVLQLRRLVIGEAGRFPELGRTYWERAFETGLTTLSAGLRRLADRGLLLVDDADVAAQHFAALVLWIPMNRAMFCGPGEHLSDARLGETADTGVRAFLRAYSPTTTG
jgi:TetR/AcrR family transcriptional repressor of mexJK operon